MSNWLRNFEIRLTVVLVVLGLIGGAYVHNILYTTSLGGTPGAHVRNCSLRNSSPQVFDINILVLVSTLVIFMPLSVLQISDPYRVKALSFILSVIPLTLATFLLGARLVESLQSLLSFLSSLSN